MPKITKLLFAGTFVGAALVTLMATGSNVAAGPDPDKAAYDKFEKAWVNKVSKRRNEAADALPSSTESAFPYYARVLEDPYWQVRLPVLSRIVKLDGSTRTAFGKWMGEYVKGKKPADVGLRARVFNQMLWAYSRCNLQTADEWKPIRDALTNDDLPWNVRAMAARQMQRWPTTPLIEINENATEEGRKELEGKNKAIQEVAQPILKANFQAYFDMLKRMTNEPKVKDKTDEKSKDNQGRLAKLNLINGMERLSGKQNGDDFVAWELFWTKVQADNSNLDYKFDTRNDIEISAGEKGSGRTAPPREKPKRDTNMHLMVMPQFGYPDDYFYPYISEMTQYFRLSTFPMPAGASVGRPYVKDPRDTRQMGPAYYYPTEKIGQLFGELRKKDGGTIGMLCHGESANIAMEYAKADPDGCAFIICVGAWSGYASQVKGRKNGENNGGVEKLKGDIAIKTFWRLAYFPKPAHTEEEAFDEETGQYLYQFADPLNPDQVEVRQDQNRFSSLPPDKGGLDTQGKQILIDDKYEFKASGIPVPTLFIWGKNDPLYTKDAEKDVTKGFPQSMVVYMPEVSRHPWLEDPIGFYTVFEDFMKKFNVWKRIEKVNKDAEKDAAKDKAKGAK